MIALLVCLIPTTIGGLLSAIGIAGMDRVLQRNVLAMSGRAVEAAGDVDVLLLDKTGTITLGNRMATAFHPAPGVEPNDLAASAQLSSLADETPEGRSIVVLAKEKFGLRAREMHELEATFVPFTAQTRMSGVDLHANGAQPTMRIRKGAAEAMRGFVESAGGAFPQAVAKTVDEISRRGGNSAGGRVGHDDPRRDRVEGRRQRRHQGTLRAVAQDGHSHRHDHRRQSAHRRSDRRRIGRGRFHGAGDSGRQTQAHSQPNKPKAASSP